MTNPISSPMEPFTPFLPTTYNIPEEGGTQRTFLADRLANFADVVNDKKIGIYMQDAATLNGNKFYFKATGVTRNGYQVIIYLSSLPNSGILTLILTSDPAFPITDINDQFVITNLYGTASKPPSAVGAGDGDYFQYNNQGDTRISFTMSDTTIIITSTVDLSAYSGFIICEFLRNGT